MNDDWYSAWGDEGWGEYEHDHNYNGDYWIGYSGNIGNVMMMLERGETSEVKKTDRNAQAKATGERDPLRNARRARPIIVYNRFTILTNDDDSDDDNNDDATTTDRHDIDDDEAMQQHKRHRPNKRQRCRRKQFAMAQNGSGRNDTDEIQCDCRQNQCMSTCCIHDDRQHDYTQHNNEMHELLRRHPDGPFTRMIRRTSVDAPPWRRVKQHQEYNDHIAKRDAAASNVTTTIISQQQTRHDTTTTRPQQFNVDRDDADVAIHKFHNATINLAQVITANDHVGDPTTHNDGEPKPTLSPSGGSPPLGPPPSPDPLEAPLPRNSSQLHWAHNSPDGGPRTGPPRD